MTDVRTWLLNLGALVVLTSLSTLAVAWALRRHDPAVIKLGRYSNRRKKGRAPRLEGSGAM